MNRTTTPTGADLDGHIQALQRRLDTATKARMRAELDRDTAAAAVADAKQRLATEFGVTTPEEATALLTRMRADLATEITAINAALDATGIA